MRFVLVTCVLSLLALSACGPDGKKGDDDDGVDALADCQNDTHRCEGSTYQTCVGGMWENAVDCPTGCVDSLGCVDCVPGTMFCKDGNVHQCDATGMPGGEVMACAGSTLCVDGACVDACAEAVTSKSYIGCEYWAADLDNAQDIVGLQGSLNCDPIFGVPGVKNATLPVCFNMMGGGAIAGFCDPPNAACPANFTCQNQPICYLDAHLSPFAIVVSNPQPKDSNVTVLGPGGQMIQRIVPAGQVASILPQMGGAIPDQSIDGTIKAAKAYKVTSDLPIVAYQFNPLDNVNVFSNDASLLIPKTAYDTDYYVMAWATLDRRNPLPGSHRFYGYVTIVSPADGTQIEVTPTVAVQASATQTTLAAGVPAMFTLNAHEVLQLQATGAGDLTGTHITSPNMMPFGVFGGHEAAFFAEATPPNPQYTSPCCADHLEEMLFPSTTWGKQFALARSAMRADNLMPPDYIRIMAQKPGTAVTFMPAPSATVSGNCGALGPGQFCDVKIMGDTEINSNEPILVGHYLQASIWSGFFDSIGNGDPSMAIAVPTEQYRKDYTILIPNSYMNNYLSISAKATGGVSVDGTPVTLTNFPGGGTHRAARVPVTPGRHTITCADGCGVLVYGYSDAVSYMFAGGLDLKPLVIL
ncbi:MAG TPA: IgGFc-binding protein [Kofleriaceae bacterium]